MLPRRFVNAIITRAIVLLSIRPSRPVSSSSLWAFRNNRKNGTLSLSFALILPRSKAPKFSLINAPTVWHVYRLGWAGILYSFC